MSGTGRLYMDLALSLKKIRRNLTMERIATVACLFAFFNVLMFHRIYKDNSVVMELIWHSSNSDMSVIWFLFCVESEEETC